MRKSNLLLSLFIILIMCLFGCTKNHEHNYGEWIEKVNSNCTTEGIKGHFYCEECNKFFDEDKEEILNINIEKAPHRYEWVIDKEATYDETGLKHQECVVCHEKKNEGTVIDKLICSHLNLIHSEKIDATCNQGGREEYYYCDECDKYFADIDCTEEILNITTFGFIEKSDIHTLSKVEQINPTCENDGSISHFHCTTCNKDFIYDGNNLTINPGGGTIGPYANWGGDPLQIIGENGNAFLKMKASGWPTWTQIDKNLSKNLLIPGDYTIMFDVKLSEAAYNGKNAEGNRGAIHIRLNYDGSENHYISMENNNISLCNTETFTTLSYNYTVNGLESKPGLSVSFIYWIEGSNVDNYILIDNIRVILKGDETKTNLDITENYGFEGLIGLKEISNLEKTITKISHQYEWVIDKEATPDEPGLKHQECIYCKDKKDEGTVIDKLTCSHEELVYIEEVESSCESEGIISHYHCSGCNQNFIYGGNNLIIDTNGGRYGPYSNWGGDPLYIIGENGDAYLKMQASGWPTWTQIDKDLSNNLLTSGEYTIMFDVKLSEAAYYGKNVSGNKGAIHIRLNYEGSNDHYITTENNNISLCNMETFTTLSYDYSISGLESKPWLTVTLIYWIEGSNIDNYIFIDNIRIIAKSDPTQKNLDNTINYGFEGLIELIAIEDLAISTDHQYGILIPEQPATCTEPGLRAHYKCSTCNMYFNEDKVEVAYDDLVIPASGDSHTLGALVLEIAATCTEPGLKAHYKCSVCNSYFDQNKNAVEYSELVIPAVGHDLILVPHKEPTAEEDGYVSHFDCTRCGTDFVYDPTAVYTIFGNSQWANYPIGNFGAANTYIVGEGTNSAFKISPTAWGQFNSLTKDTGPKLAKPGTYILSFNLKGGTNINAVKAGKLDIHFHYEIPGQPEAKIIISDGAFNLGNVKNTEWITVTYEFTVPAGANGNWSNFLFFYWPELSLEGNYLLMDNFMVYAKSDPTKINLDTLGRGDFEGFLKQYVILEEENKIIPKLI